MNKLFSKISDLYLATLNLYKEKPWRLILVFIILLALGLRLYKIDSLTGGLSSVEVEYIKRILTLQKPEDFWLGLYFKEGLYLYLGALAFKIFGAKLIVIKVMSAIIGTLTVFLAYLFTREWFNRQAGYFASFLLAISSWHVAISRNISPDILLPFIILLLLFITNLGFRTKKSIYFVLSGIIFGLGLYVNAAFIFAPLIFLIAGVYFYLKNRKFVTAYLRELTYAVDAFVIVSIPYFISFFKYPSKFLAQYNFSNPENWLINLGSSIQSIFIKNEVSYFYGLGIEPLVDPFVAMLFLFGAGFALVHIKRRKNLFLLLLFFIMLMPGVFSNGTVVDKVIGTMPAVFIISAVSLNYVSRHWFKTFPFNKFARYSLVFGISFFFLISAYYNIQKYFSVWANSDGVEKTYNKNYTLPKQ